MPLNKKERELILSVKKKIQTHDIPTTLKEAFNYSNGNIVYTIYNDNSTEMVDSGVEVFLIKKSFAYFLDRYCRVDIPGLGTVDMNPYYFQKEMAKEVLKFRKVVVDKTRQCLTEDNFVMTSRGYLSIKDVQVGDKIETVVNGVPVFTDVLDSFYNGEKEVCRVLTNSGAELKLTLDHRVFTKRGWVEAGGLTLEDEIVSIINKGSFGDFEFEDDKLPSLIGYYLADGKSSQPYFVNTNLNYINEVVEAGKLFENCAPYIYERDQIRNRKPAYEARLVSETKSANIERPVRNFLSRFGLDAKSENRNLVNDLMNLNKRQMSIMLNRLYAGDGWINYRRDKRRPNYIQYEIGLGSPSYSLIKQIEYILQTKYGIHCYVRESIEEKNKDGKKFYRLKVSQKKSVIKFINEIGIKDKTDTQEIKELISNESPYETNQSYEKIRKLEKIEGLYSVYDITTLTSDFLTNGLLVHNCGISTIFSLYTLWRANFFASENIDVISLKQQKAQQFINKMKSTLNNLPDWLKTPISVNNQKQISFSHPNGSTSTIVSEPQSDNAGRSDSLSLLIMDELAFYQSDRMVREIISAATPTLTKTGGQAIYISTPNGTTGAGSYYYGQVQEAKQELDPDTKYLEIDWWEVPDDPRIGGPKKGYNHVLNEAIKNNYYYNRKVKEKYKKFFEPIAKNHDANPWLKATFADLKDIKFKQEILHEFVIDGDRVFGPDLMAKVKAGLKDPISKDYLWNDGRKLREQRGFWIWNHPETGHRYILGCLPAGEKVLTTNGLKDIEKIEETDILFDKDGNETKIVNKQIYENIEEPLYKIKVEGILRETSFTGEHPIMSSINTKISRKGNSKKYRPRKWEFNFTYNNVSALNKGDWLIYPNVYRNKCLDENSILREWKKFSSGRKDFNLDENIILDKDFWWFLGIWLAEGWTQERGYSKSIHTCHNFSKEYVYAEKIRKLFKKYNRDVYFTEKPDSNVIETGFNSSQLFAFINENFGKYAKNKSIPEWMKYAPEEFKKELIVGYLNGDGFIFIDNRRQNYNTSFVSISKKLLEDIQDILFSLGFVSSLVLSSREGTCLFKNRKKESITQNSYQLSMRHHETIKFMKEMNIDYDISKESLVRKSIGHNFISDDLKYIYLRISSIEKNDFSGTVYNFETESHSYLCNYLTTHNCDVASGTSSDTSTIQVVDLETMNQVAEFKGYISTPMFAKLVKDVARIYNDAFVVIECNSIGDTIFSNVYYSDNDPYGNVYKQKKTKNGITRFTGWITDVKTRKLMVSDFIDWVAVPELAERFHINSERLYAEMETWIWVANDKAMHADNCLTGDTVITCKSGFKKIKDIHIGELVLNEKGDFSPVRDKFEIKADREVLKEVEASGMPKLNITDKQRILTYRNKYTQYDNVYNIKNGDFVYSKFSDLVLNYNTLNLTEIASKMRNGKFKPNESQLYAHPIIQLELIRFLVRRGKIKRFRKVATFKTRNYQSLYFLAHILYRNRVIFSMSHNKITISNQELYRICPDLYKKEPDYKEIRKYYGSNLSSKIKKIKESLREEKILYDLDVENVHSYVANSYIVHNCHDDAIMAMSLCLHLRDKAALQENSMFIAEDGSVITYDRNEAMKRAEEENVSFSSIDGFGKKKLAIQGSNPSGIASNTEDFGSTDMDRKLREIGVSSMDELKWLLGG